MAAGPIRDRLQKFALEELVEFGMGGERSEAGGAAPEQGRGEGGRTPVV